MKKQRKSTKSFLAAILASSLLTITIHTEIPEVPGQQEDVACYTCNNDKNPLGSQVEGE